MCDPMLYFFLFLKRTVTHVIIKNVYQSVQNINLITMTSFPLFILKNERGQAKTMSY